MDFESLPATINEFYTNIHKHDEDYFETWLRDKPIRVDADMISTITHTPRVPDLVYRWAVAERPLRSALEECFTEGRPHGVILEGAGGFALGSRTMEARLVYRIIASRVYSIKSINRITFERGMCLYTVLTHVLLDFCLCRHHHHEEGRRNR